RISRTSADEVVEVPIAGAEDERLDLLGGVDQRRAFWIPRVPYRDAGTVRELSQLDAVSTRVAAPALAPPESGELSGRDAVVCLRHLILSIKVIHQDQPRSARTRPAAESAASPATVQHTASSPFPIRGRESSARASALA